VDDVSARRNGTATAAVLVSLVAVVLMSGCAPRPAAGLAPVQSGEQPAARTPGGIAVPDPTAPADAARKAVDDINAQTRQMEQGVQDAAPTGQNDKP
jgi:hypothetical protein